MLWHICALTAKKSKQCGTPFEAIAELPLREALWSAVTCHRFSPRSEGVEQHLITHKSFYVVLSGLWNFCARYPGLRSLALAATWAVTLRPFGT